MPDCDDENHPLTSSKKFSSIRFRRLSISSKRRSELKAAISVPHVFDGGGVSAITLGNLPLQALENTRFLHSNSAAIVTSGLPPPQSTLARGIRRNSDIPFEQHHSNFTWPTNHPEIISVYGSPHHTHRTTYKKPRKAEISKPFVPDSSRSSSVPGISRKGSHRSTQINRRPRFSGPIAAAVVNRNSDEVASQKPSLSDKLLRVSNLLGSPSDEFDPRIMMESYATLDLDLTTSAASFGSVKQRTRKIDKALRASRTMLLPVPQANAKPDLVYTEDSDALPSPPSTPSTPVWETNAIPPIPKIDPKIATKLDLADVHAQIQAMIDSTNRPSSTDSGDFLECQGPSNTYQTSIPPCLRPSNPMSSSFPQLTTAHRRSASSPPLGSGTYHTYPSGIMDRMLYHPVTPVKQDSPTPPTCPPSKPKLANPISSTSADMITPSTPTKKSFSERSDSPSVYSQQSPSSQIDNVTPSSSNASSPDHPYAKNKHERLLAAISEGIPSPTKPGSVTPSTLWLGHSRSNKLDPPDPPLHTGVSTVPVIVVTDPDDDDLVYSESSFSIIDMYAGSAESTEGGRRRRTRTANSVSHIDYHALAAY